MLRNCRQIGLSTGCRLFTRWEEGVSSEHAMERLHYGQNFEKSLYRKIYYHSTKEHPKISKLAKFGTEKF